MKSKSEIYLCALLDGRRVDIGLSYPLFLHEDGDGKFILCFDYADRCSPTCDITLHDFINVCNKKTDDESFIVASETALSKMNREKGTRK